MALIAAAGAADDPTARAPVEATQEPQEEPREEPPNPDDVDQDPVQALLNDVASGNVDAATEAEIIHSFIRFAPFEFDDRRARPVMGLAAAVSIPQHRLGPAPAARLLVGVRLPWRDGVLSAIGVLDGVRSRREDAGDDPQPWQWTIHQEDLALGVGAGCRVLGARERLSPELSLTPQIVRIRTTVEGGPVGLSPRREEAVAWRPGVGGSAGISLIAGPGYLELLSTVAYAPLDQALTGTLPQVRVGVGLGYRFVLVVQKPG